MNIASTANSPVVTYTIAAAASWRRLRRRGGTAAVSCVNIYRIVYTIAMKLDRINIICTFNIKFVSIYRATCGFFIDDSIHHAASRIDIQIIITMIIIIIIIISIIISIVAILLANIEYKSSFITAGLALATNARFTYYFPISHRIPRYMITVALQSRNRCYIWNVCRLYRTVPVERQKLWRKSWW